MFVSRGHWRTPTPIHLIKLILVHVNSFDSMIVHGLVLFCVIIALMKILILVTFPGNSIHLGHNLIDNILVVPLFLPQHLYLVLQLIQHIRCVQVIVLFQKLILFLKAFENRLVLCYLNCELLIHLHDNVALLQEFFS